MSSNGSYTMFKGYDHNWYWRYVASNGRQISRSSEGYVNKSDCRRSIDIMKSSQYDPVYEE